MLRPRVTRPSKRMMGSFADSEAGEGFQVTDEESISGESEGTPAIAPIQDLGLPEKLELVW